MENGKSVIKTLIYSIKNTCTIIYRYNKYYILISGIVLVVQGIIPTLLIIIMQEIINMLQKGTSQFSDIICYIICYIILNVISSFVTAIYSYYNSCFTLGFNKHISLKILDKALELDLKDYENSETYNKINRTQNQNGYTVIAFLTRWLEMLRELVTIGSTLFILIKFRWWIIGLVLIMPIIQCSLSIILDKEWYKIRISRTTDERKGWYINFLILTGNAIKEIKLLGIGEFLINKYNTIRSNIIKQDLKMNKKVTVISMIFEFADWGVTGGILVYIFYQGFLKLIMLGDVNAYIDCIFNIKNSIKGIFDGTEEITEQSLYISLLYEFFDLKVQEKKSSYSISDIHKIELKNVSYRYENGNYAIKNVNLTINKGECIALIGKNGAGKTTLVKIILGLYDDYEGEIFINDINLRNIDYSTYYKAISCIFQDYVKYEASIRENVAFGDIDKIDDDYVICRMLHETKLNESIYSQKGIDTVIGNWFGDKQVSTGEWQRIAIARALIRDADLYIFDEPDASLDILRQRELLDTYKSILINKIGIYVSHKINFVHIISTHIYVLEEGEIIEQGTHESLLKKGGAYQRLYNESKELEIR